MDLLSQIFGIIASITALGSLQFKNIIVVLVLQAICNAAGAASFVFAGGISACGIYLVAVLQSLVFLVYRLKGKTAPNIFTWVFAALFVLCSALTYSVPADLISMLAAITCALALAQKNSTVYRIIIAINGTLWVIYDLVMAAYGMVPAHIITIASALIGIIRLDLKLFKKNNK